MAGARARAGTVPSNYRSDGSTIDIFKSWTTNREDLASRVTVAVTALKNACAARAGSSTSPIRTEDGVWEERERARRPVVGGVCRRGSCASTARMSRRRRRESTETRVARACAMDAARRAALCPRRARHEHFLLLGLPSRIALREDVASTGRHRVSRSRRSGGNASVARLWSKRVLRGAVLVLLLAPIKAVAGLIEYALILTLVAILVVVALQLPPGATTVTRQLQSTVLTAQAANNGGHKSQELSNLSKAIGLEEALRGMIATCDSSACSAAAPIFRSSLGSPRSCVPAS